jgi:hypothetical protein
MMSGEMFFFISLVKNISSNVQKLLFNLSSQTGEGLRVRVILQMRK